MCDGRPDCPGGADELNCGGWKCAEGYVKCRDGKQCVKASHMCDGFREHCGDSSDEDGEICRDWECPDGRMRPNLVMGDCGLFGLLG